MFKVDPTTKRIVQEMSAPDRLEALIEKRAPGLKGDSFSSKIGRKVVEWLLDYEYLVTRLATVEHMTTRDIMLMVSAHTAPKIHITGLENLPKEGGALMLANHPTGIADGLVVHSVVNQVRDDFYVLINNDVLTLLPQFEDTVVPIEWDEHLRTRAKTKLMFDRLKYFISNDRIGLIFPAGSMSQRKGFKLQENPWIPTAATLSKKYDLPIVPMHLTARNTYFFYAMDAIHPALKNVTLFTEMLNKSFLIYEVRIGKPIMPGEISGTVQEITDKVREIVLDLPKQIDKEAFAAQRFELVQDPWPDSPF